MTDYIELIASFTRDDFILDYETVAKKEFTEDKRQFEQAWQAQFRANKDQTLFYFGFNGKWGVVFAVKTNRPGCFCFLNRDSPL